MADRKMYSIYNMQRKKFAWQNVQKQNILQNLRCQHVIYNSRMVKENENGKRELKNFNDVHAAELNIRRESVRRILQRDLRFHPYKIMVVQEQSEGLRAALIFCCENAGGV
jgi:hypothetical protein